MDKSLIDIVKEEVPKKLLEKGNLPAGTDLTKMNFNFMEIKKILYDVLKGIEVKQLEEKWGSKYS